MRGGAMYAIENGVSKKTGINFKWVAVLFAVFALFASFGVGCGVQTNAIAKIMDTTFNPDKTYMLHFFGMDISTVALISGVVIAICVALVIFGGIKSISRVCENSYLLWQYSMLSVVSLFYQLTLMCFGRQLHLFASRLSALRH